MRWWERLADLAAKGSATTVVTVTGTRGSTPRELGATLLVTKEATFGSIGGGQLEYQCAAIGAQLLQEDNRQTSIRRFTLGADSGQCCGGVAEVLFEVIEPGPIPWLSQGTSQMPAALVTEISRDDSVTRRIVAEIGQGPAEIPHEVFDAFLMAEPPPVSVFRHGQKRFVVESLSARPFSVSLFGAGHVGSTLVHMLHPTGCRIDWYDSRDGMIPTTLPDGVRAFPPTEPAQAAAAAAPGSYAFVMTHSHSEDFSICTVLLQREDLGAVGLIGSRSKRRNFEKRWEALGLDERQVQRLICPIGLPGINGKAPGRIAVATAAQILELESQRRIPAAAATVLEQV